MLDRSAPDCEPVLGLPHASAPLSVPLTVPAARIAGVAVHLPARVVPVLEAERRLAERNPGVVPPPGIVGRMTGVRAVHVAPDDWQASDLAVAATRSLMAEQGLAARDVDLLLFTSASQDMVEPATSHIVAASLGLTCPVMDVKNACNSVLNGLEVAEALIGTGRYDTVLVVSGEMPSRAVRWDVPDRAAYLRSAPGYTMSDGGAALLLRATVASRWHGPDAAPRAVAPGRFPAGILSAAFSAASQHWDVGTLPGGGTRHPRDPDRTYFDIDGGRLREAFLALGPGTVLDALARAGVTWDDVALVAVHQVAVTYLQDVHRALGLPAERTLMTVEEHGNLASVTLPLQLDLAMRSGRVGAGDVVVLVGLAGGISIGAMVVRL